MTPSIVCLVFLTALTLTGAQYAIMAAVDKTLAYRPLTALLIVWASWVMVLAVDWLSQFARVCRRMIGRAR